MAKQMEGASGVLLLCTYSTKADTSSAQSSRCMRRWGAEPRAADRWPEDDAPAERWAAAPEEHDHAPGLCQVSCHTHSLQEGQWARPSRWLQTMQTLVPSSQLQWCSTVVPMCVLARACNWLSKRDCPPMQTMCSTRCWQTPHSACRRMMGAAVMCRLPQQPMEAERLRTAGNPLRGILPRSSF